MGKPEPTIDWNAIDWERVDQAALALLLLGLHEGSRPWKGFDWQILDRLHEKGFIGDPKSKAKSVVFSEEGLKESRRLFQRSFARSPTQLDLEEGTELPAGGKRAEAE